MIPMDTMDPSLMPVAATVSRPDNAVLVVVGDFDPAQLQKWADAYFGPIAKPESPIPRVTVKEPERSGPQVLREYDPQPPFNAGHPRHARPEIVSMISGAKGIMGDMTPKGVAIAKAYRLRMAA